MYSLIDTDRILFKPWAFDEITVLFYAPLQSILFIKILVLNDYWNEDNLSDFKTPITNLLSSLPRG